MSRQVRAARSGQRPVDGLPTCHEYAIFDLAMPI